MMDVMTRFAQRPTHLRQSLWMLTGLFLCVYFGYHLMAGERSYLRYTLLQNDIRIEEQKLDALRAKHDTLETRVAAMRPGQISPDLLEEQARGILGYVKPDEYMIFPQKN